MRDVCQRTGSKAMLTGSIAALGNQYVIGLKAVNCNTGDVLAEAQEQAASKEAVLRLWTAAAISFAEQAGRVAEFGAEVRHSAGEATTPSLEALKAYSLGQRRVHERGRSRPAFLQASSRTRSQLRHGLHRHGDHLQ